LVYFVDATQHIWFWKKSQVLVEAISCVICGFWVYTADGGMLHGHVIQKFVMSKVRKQVHCLHISFEHDSELCSILHSAVNMFHISFTFTKLALGQLAFAAEGMKRLHAAC
jgi:L-asparaginase II